MDQIARNIPGISTTFQDRKVENRSTMIEIKGTVLNQTVFVLIYLRASLSYISLQIVEQCNLKYEKFENAWLV